MTQSAGVSPSSGPHVAESRSKKKGPLRGFLYIGAAAFFWGVSASLGRAAFTGRLLPGSGVRSVDPLILSQCRTSFSFLAVALGLFMRRGLKPLRLPLRDLGKIFVLGLAGVAASNYFYYLAIQSTNVATAIIVQYTAPVWVLLYVVARRQQRLSLQKVAAVAVAITGIALTIGIVRSNSARVSRFAPLARNQASARRTGLAGSLLLMDPPKRASRRSRG